MFNVVKVEANAVELICRVEPAIVTPESVEYNTLITFKLDVVKLDCTLMMFIESVLPRVVETSMALVMLMVEVTKLDAFKVEGINAIFATKDDAFPELTINSLGRKDEPDIVERMVTYFRLEFSPASV
jgi:hypothetical protein